MQLPHFSIHLQYHLVLLSLILIGTTQVQAQNELMLRDTIVDADYYEQRGDWFKINQWGLAFSLMRDEALSPLRYNGFGIFWNNNQYKFKPRVFVRQQWQFYSVSFTNSQSESLLSQSSVEFIHARHQPIALANEKLKVYVGGFVSGLLNLKIHPENVNNVLSYELAASLGPSGMIQWPVTVFGKQFVLSDELQFPLISLLGNTPYAWPIPTSFDEEGTLSDAFAVGSWGKLLRVTNQFNVDFHRRVRRRKKVVKRVAYRFSYRWEFVSVAEPNLYQAGTHSFSFARIIAQ